MAGVYKGTQRIWRSTAFEYGVGGVHGKALLKWKMINFTSKR